MSACEVCQGKGLPSGCVFCGATPPETTVYTTIGQLRGMFPPVQRRGGQQ